MPVTGSNPHTSRVIPRDYVSAFILVTSLFFMWAVAHNMNDILIRQFQKALDLSRGQASFIQVSFYLAYAVAAIPAGYAMKKLGFKRAILTGLLLYALGAALFYPAAEVGNYSFFLVALFIIVEFGKDCFGIKPLTFNRLIFDTREQTVIPTLDLVLADIDLSRSESDICGAAGFVVKANFAVVC